MRMLVALVALCGPAIATSQITSSANLGCKVVAPSGMACNGIGVPETKEEGKRLPKLFITHFTLERGAALDQLSSSSDCLLVGINGGDLVNERAPFYMSR